MDDLNLYKRCTLIGNAYKIVLIHVFIGLILNKIFILDSFFIFVLLHRFY